MWYTRILFRNFSLKNASNSDSISNGPCIVVKEYVHLIWGENLEEGTYFPNIEIYYSRRELSGIGKKDDKKPSFSFPSIAVCKLSFTFSLSEPSFVRVSFYDLAGRKVKEVSLGFKGRGTHRCSVSLDLPSGVYFPILRAGTQVFRGKIIFINP